MEPRPPSTTYAAFRGGLAAAIERGERARHQWTLDGTLLGPEAFAALRGVMPAELRRLEARGSLFSLEVRGDRWYPAELLRMSTSNAADVCAALGELEPIEKFVFVTRAHGALAGKTVADAIANGATINRVLDLAAAWRAEHLA